MTLMFGSRMRAAGRVFRLLAVAAVVCLLGFAGPSRAAPVLLNGSFENLISGFDTDLHLCNNNTGVGSTCTSNLQNWSARCATGGCVATNSPSSIITNATGSGFNANLPGNTGFGFASAGTNSPNGGNYVALDGDPAYRDQISQSVSGLTIGRWYQVQFYMGGAQQGGTTADAVTAQMRVTFDTAANITGVNGLPALNTAGTAQATVCGATLNASGTCQVTNDANTNPSVRASGSGSTSTWRTTGWFQETLFFKAVGTTQTLAFTAIGSPSGGPPITLLDGVTLTDTPEPGTLALMGSGLLMMLVFGWRRNRAQQAVAAA